jgi:microcystin-dependent protein
MLQTAADLSASITAQGISSLVPAGVIMAFGGATAPTGWLLCDGSAISRTTYATLFASISTAHGYGDNSTTFNLPDYRGRFIRGRDGAVARDPDRAARTAAATGGNTGDNVGSVQATATKTPTNAWSMTAAATGNATLTAHSHSTSGGGGGTMVTSPSNSGTSVAQTGAITIGNGGTINNANIDHSHSVSIASGGDNESRPLNAYVNYIIKI